MKYNRFLIISMIIAIVMSCCVITAFAQNINIIPRETLDGFRSSIDVNQKITQFPFKSMVTASNYIVWEDGIVDSNIVFNYSGIRDYVSLGDAVNTTRYDGVIVAKTRVKFVDEFTDFRYVVTYDDATPLAELMFTRTSGAGRVRGTYGATAYTEIIPSSVSAFPMNKWFVLKIELNTLTKSYSVYFDLEDGNGEILKYANAPFRYKDDASYVGKYSVKDIRFAFNRMQTTAPVGSKYYLDNFELSKSLLPLAISNINVVADVGDSYVLPQTVSAAMNDGTNKQLNIVWDSGTVDTSTVGTTVYYGTVQDYQTKIKLTLDVQKRTITSIQNINAVVRKRDTYSFPTQVDAIMDDNSSKKLNVTWDSTNLSTQKTGTFTLQGTVVGWSSPVTLTVVVEPLDIVSIKDLDIYISTTCVRPLPKTVNVSLADGRQVYEDITWTADGVNFAQVGMYNATGQVEGYNKPVNAKIYIYETTTPVIKEEFDEKKAGFILRNAPWLTNSPTTCVVRQDINDPDNKIGEYYNSKDFAGVSAPTKYNGLLVAEIDLKLPLNFTTFKFEVCNPELTYQLTEVYFVNANRRVRIDSALATIRGWDYAFPLDEWFNCKVIADTHTKLYSIFINNVLIAKDVPFRFAEVTGMSWYAQIIRIANRDGDAGFLANFDNIRMYALNDFITDEYNSLNVPSVVTSNLDLAQNAGDGIKITWSSNNPQYISNDGIITRPEWLAGDQTAVLTALVEKNVGCGIANDTKSFTITIKQKEATDTQAVDFGEKHLLFSNLTNEQANQITADLTLPTSIDNGVLVKWTSSSPDVIDEIGRVIMPDTPVTLTLTAEISRGLVKETKDFTVTVLAITTMTDVQAVRRARIALSIPTTATSNISLPLSGANEVQIAWESNNFSAVSNNGNIQRLTSDQTAILTAVVTRGEYRELKTFTVLVPRTEVINGSGGGGGGGGSTITYKANVVIPPINQDTNTNGFTDISDVLWAKEAINNLLERAVISKNDNNKFEPMSNITREEFVKIVMVGFNLINDEASLENPFIDVSKNDWSYSYISKAKKIGIVSGYPDGRFGSGEYITRQDIAVMICKAAEFAGTVLHAKRGAKIFIDDTNISNYARSSITTLYTSGIINGMENGSFMPQSNATRAEAAKMLYEIIK